MEADDVAKVRHMNKVLAGFQGEFEFEERLDDDLLEVRRVSLVALPAPGGSCVSILSGLCSSVPGVQDLVLHRKGRDARRTPKEN